MDSNLIKSVWLSFYHYILDNEVQFQGSKIGGGKKSIEDALEAAIFATLFTIVILFQYISGAITDITSYIQDVRSDPGEAMATLAEDNENMERAKELIDDSELFDISTIYAIEDNPEKAISVMFSSTKNLDVTGKAVIAKLTKKLGSLGATFVELQKTNDLDIMYDDLDNRKRDRIFRQPNEFKAEKKLVKSRKTARRNLNQGKYKNTPRIDYKNVSRNINRNKLNISRKQKYEISTDEATPNKITPDEASTLSLDDEAFGMYPKDVSDTTIFDDTTVRPNRKELSEEEKWGGRRRRSKTRRHRKKRCRCSCKRR